MKTRVGFSSKRQIGEEWLAKSDLNFSVHSSSQGFAAVHKNGCKNGNFCDPFCDML